MNKGYFPAREFKQVNTFDSANQDHVNFMKNFGVSYGMNGQDSFGFDAQESFISGGVSANISNLRTFLPGTVKQLTTVRKIDELLGQTTAGDWYMEEVTQRVEEQTATTKPYADGVDIPFTSYNSDYESRTIVRFVIGMQSEMLGDGRARKIGENPDEIKRNAAAVALEIARNEVGFYGYNNGANKTYGFLNDPNLPAYVTLPNGAGGNSEWSTKTFVERQADFTSAVSSIMVSSGGNFDPTMHGFTWAIPLAVATTLTEVNQYGISIQKWINETYPKCRIIYVPELDSANGGANVFYMYAEQHINDSTDGGGVFDQLVAEKFMSIGRGQEVGGFKEGFTNAMAGTLLKRPYLVYRATGM